MEAVVEQPLESTTESAPVFANSYPRLFRAAESSLAFAAQYMGVGLSSVATAVLSYFTFAQAVTLPSTPTNRALVVLSLMIVSGFVGVIANSFNIMQVQQAATENGRYRERSRDLANRLRDAMEEVVTGWAAGLLVGLATESVEVDTELDIELHVFVPSDGVYRVIASSADSANHVRRIELQPAEGMVAQAYEKKNPLVLLLDGTGSGTLWSRKGRNLGPQRPLREENLDRCHPRLQWVYATPIYESRDGVFRTDRPLGVLTVDGLNSNSETLYFKPEFQEAIEGVAAQLGPYLNALESLLPAALR